MCIRDRDPCHRLLPQTRQAVLGLEARGVPFVIVTARGPTAVAPLLQDMGLRCGVISFSGGLMRDPAGRTLFHRGFPKEEARRLLDYLEGWPVTVCIYAFDQWLARDRSDPRVTGEEAVVHAQARQGWLEDLTGEEVHKLLCMGEPTDILRLERQMVAAFPGYSIVRSADTLLEVMAGGVTKAWGVRQACAHYGIPLEEAAAFGDNYNDMEMLQAVGRGFLMGNAPRAVSYTHLRGGGTARSLCSVLPLRKKGRPGAGPSRPGDGGRPEECMTSEVLSYAIIVSLAPVGRTAVHRGRRQARTGHSRPERGEHPV